MSGVHFRQRDEQHQWIKDNRHYISAVVNALKFTATHRLAQPGHGETRESVNAGNSIDLMKLIGQYNDTVGKKLTDLPRHSNMFVITFKMTFWPSWQR